MGRTNRTRYAVLGALSLGPRTGYQVKKDIESSVGHFWAESPGQLYPILKALVAEGLATVEDAPSGGRSRKVYSVTEAGLEVFREWLCEPPERTKGRNELLLKLFFARQAGRDVAIEHLTAAMNDAAGRAALLRGIRTEVENEEPHPDKPYFLLTIDFGVRNAEAVRQWCAASIETLQNLDEA